MLILSKPRVFRLSHALKFVSDEDVDELIDACRLNSWDYARICLHEDNSVLMSMILVMINRFIYPPHRHPWKTESYMVLRGVADLELYDLKSRKLEEVRTMRPGDFFHNDYDGYHTFRPKADEFVFLESTHGPLSNQALEFLEGWEP